MYNQVIGAYAGKKVKEEQKANHGHEAADDSNQQTDDLDGVDDGLKLVGVMILGHDDVLIRLNIIEDGPDLSRLVRGRWLPTTCGARRRYQRQRACRARPGRHVD